MDEVVEYGYEDTVVEEVKARRGRKPKVVEAVEPDTEDDVAEEVAVKRETKAVEVQKLFPVIMKRNYHPVNDFTIDGEKPTAEQRVKVFAGTAIEMDRDEAKAVIASGIAVRNDPIY